jgi:hypothetical protein
MIDCFRSDRDKLDQHDYQLRFPLPAEPRGSTVSAQRYGPEHTWLRHQKPFWNTALTQARLLDHAERLITKRGRRAVPGGAAPNRAR